MDERIVTLDNGTRVSNTWTITRKLGAGAFGAVYLCRDDNKRQGAMKTEPHDAEPPLLAMEVSLDFVVCFSSPSQLILVFVLFQAKVLGKLHKIEDGRHFCRFLKKGQDTQQDAATKCQTTFNYIV